MEWFALGWKEVRMLDAKLVADLITATRGLLGLMIVWLGLTQRVEALPIVIVLMLLDWTGDFVDGAIAQRSRHPRHTWVGDSDLYIDLFVSLCLAVYLLESGFASFGIVSLYMLGWAVLLWRLTVRVERLLDRKVFTPISNAAYEAENPNPKR